MQMNSGLFIPRFILRSFFAGQLFQDWEHMGKKKGKFPAQPAGGEKTQGPFPVLMLRGGLSSIG